MKSQVSRAILRTLIYAQVFNAGIRRADLRRWLLSPTPFTDHEMMDGIHELLRLRVVTQTEGWLFLADVGHSRKKHVFFQAKQKQSKQKIKQARMLLSGVSWLPTILGIAVTGSVAVGNAESGEDIDLMIITRSGFLWTTRVVVSFILFVSGSLRTRRTRDSLANKLCLNLWLDDSALVLPKKNLYVARELVQTQWLIDRDRVRLRLMRSNTWVQGFVSSMLGKSRTKKLMWASASRPGLVSKIFLPLERACFVLQRKRMRPTRERVTLHSAFFHPRDAQGQVLRRYLELCRQYNVDSLMD